MNSRRIQIVLQEMDSFWLQGEGCFIVLALDNEENVNSNNNLY